MRVVIAVACIAILRQRSNAGGHSWGNLAITQYLSTSPHHLSLALALSALCNPALPPLPPGSILGPTTIIVGESQPCTAIQAQVTVAPSDSTGPVRVVPSRVHGS